MLGQPFLTKEFAIRSARFHRSVGKHYERISGRELEIVLLKLPIAKMAEDRACARQFACSSISAKQHWRIVSGVAVSEVVGCRVEYSVE